MEDLFKTIWSNETWLWALGVISIISFIASLVLIPYLIVRMPADYFSAEKRHKTPWADQHILIRSCLITLKNCLGLVLVVMGLAMLVLPGQGLLTIFIGLICLNFPGKYRLEKWLIQQKSIQRSIDWLRQRAGKEPLKYD
jgi:uncharacterized membrane protein